MTNFTREINRLLLGLLFGFIIMTLAATYYALIGHFTLLQREDNPRLVEAQRAILRGTIYDRTETQLATSTHDSNGFAVREYTEPAMSSALGYYSYRYGAAGVEAAYDDILIGADLPPNAAQLLLNQPVMGSDIRLTFDLSVQQAIVDAMQDQTGAAVVMTVPDGNLLAMVSLPTYNANTLDQDWPTLIEADGNPFFNRVLQGTYQPGSLLQTSMILTALERDQTLSVQFPSGSQATELDDITLSCLIQPPQANITLREAYLYGCPTPFAQIAPSFTPAAIRSTFDILRLEEPITLNGFIQLDPEAPTTRTRLSRTNLRDNVLGQGGLSLSPMNAAMVMAAIINDGNAPRPRVITAQRPPSATTWQPLTQHIPTSAYMTAPNARRLSEILRASAQEGTASHVDWGTLDAGGQAALAYAGDETHVWFTGFAVLPTRENVVVAVVLENTDNYEMAVEIGKTALEAAHIAITPPEMTTTTN